ncbi:MAG: hypothetical protein ACI848_000843 [Roseivirga sp.]|jgi:hypothetical protein
MINVSNNIILKNLVLISEVFLFLSNDNKRDLQFIF